MNEHRRVAGALVFGLQPLLLNAIGLFATAYIIRRLGPAQYGAWAVALSLTSANAFLTNLGLRPLFIRSLTRSPKRAEELLAEQLALRLALSLVGGLSALLLAVLLRYPPIVIACVLVSNVSLFLAVAWTALGDVLQALQRLRGVACATLTGGVCLTGVSVVVAATGGGPVAISLAYVTGPLVTLGLLAWAVRREGVALRIRCNGSRAKALLLESKAIAGQQFVQTIRDRAEELLVPKLVGITPFGLFAAGTMPSSRLAQIPDGIATAFYAPMARQFTEGDRSSATRHIGALIAVSLATTLPLALAVSFLAPAIASLLLMSGAETCSRVMQITAWSVPLTALAIAITYAMQAAGRHEVVARVTIRATAISVLTSSALIWNLGIIGASWAWLARPLVLVALLMPPFLDLCPDVRSEVPLWRILASVAVAGVLLWLVPQEGRALMAAGGWATIAGLAYAVMLVGLRVVPLPAIARLIGGAKRQIATVS